MVILLNNGTLTTKEMEDHNVKKPKKRENFAVVRHFPRLLANKMYRQQAK